MKILFIILLGTLLAKNGFSQTKADSMPLQAFIGAQGKYTFSLNDFQKQDSIKITYDSLSVSTYIAYFFHPTVQKEDEVPMVWVAGNSLKSPDFLLMFKNFKPPFMITFDDIKLNTKYGIYNAPPFTVTINPN